ncbi:Ribonuclease H1, partial [Termitomyces sp. J132]
LSFAPMTVSPELKVKMPIWLHRGKKKEKGISINSKEMKCLRDIHNVRTVGDMRTIGEILSGTIGAHKARKNCACQKCKEMRRKGCKNPHKCSNMARLHLSKLHERWSPYSPEITRSLSEAEKGWLTDDKKLLFDLNIEMKRSLTEGFRVFIKHTEEVTEDINYNRIPEEDPLLETIYTDGSCIKDDRGQVAAGAGIWFSLNDPRNRAIRLPYYIAQTNNAGETIAILEAARSVPNTQSILLKSDSQITIDNLTSLLTKHEDEGWIGTANSNILCPLIACLHERKGLTILEKVKAHAEITGNEGADCLADQGARKTLQDEIDLRIPKGYDLSGAKLVSVMQALVYKGILESQLAPTRRGTAVNLDMTRWAAKDRIGVLPLDRVIWKSLRDKALSREIRNFLWKSMHGLYKLGKYWENIPSFESRATCPKCRVEELMAHILTECKVSGLAHIWTLTEKTFNLRKVTFRKPSIGDILGCTITGGDNMRDAREETFRSIVIAEAAYTIWKARCKWRITREADPDHVLSRQEVVSQMRAALERKIKLDCMATDAERYGKKVVMQKKVHSMWKHLMSADSTPLTLWRKITEVLVGIG